MNHLIKTELKVTVGEAAEKVTAELKEIDPPSDEVCKLLKKKEEKKDNDNSTTNKS